MIRPAAGADIPELALLWNRYRAEAGDDRWTDDEQWRGWMLRRIAAGDVRIGIVERRMHAYVAWQRIRDATSGTRTLVIRELYVHPEGRGQRLGSGLLARAIDAARQRDCDTVELVGNIHDEGARALVGPFGFDLTGDALRLQLQQR
ncbi:MAG: GNAT family N-acetyltransferase [Thermoleophilia bacterium]